MNRKEAEEYLSRPKTAVESVWIFLRYRMLGISEEWRRSARYGLQRMFRGYDDSMAYGYVHTMSEISVKALRKMLAYGNSYPGYDGADTFEKWQSIVEQIIDGFQAVIEMDDYSFTDKAKREEAEKRFANGMALYAKWYLHLWD